MTTVIIEKINHSGAVGEIALAKFGVRGEGYSFPNGYCDQCAVPTGSLSQEEGWVKVRMGYGGAWYHPASRTLLKLDRPNQWTIQAVAQPLPNCYADLIPKWEKDFRRSAQ